MLGGRVAEETMCSDISTGAENDLEKATALARQMVCRFGMSDKLGAIYYDSPGPSPAIAAQLGFGRERAYGEKTAQLIDAEIRAIVDEQLGRAKIIVAQRRAELDVLAARLLQVETLEGPELQAMLANKAAPTPA